jgi:hypothetical protein
VTVARSTARVESDAGAIAWKRVAGIKAGDRPLIVWIADANGDSSVEHHVFDDESVRLASRAFRTVRIQPELARVDPYLAAYARSAPTLVVFSPDLKRASSTPKASLSPATTLDALRASARNDEGMDLDAALKKAKTLIAEEHSVEASKAAVVGATPADISRRAELDRRLVALRAEVDSVLHPPLPVAR